MFFEKSNQFPELFPESFPLENAQVINCERLAFPEIVPKNVSMNASEIQNELVAIAEKLQAIAKSIESDVEVPKEISDLIGKRCLYCKEPFKEGESITRGIHKKCKKLLDNDSISDSEAIKSGLILKKSAGGRKKKRPPTVEKSIEAIKAKRESASK